MSVNPGRGGQKFLKKTNARLEYLINYRKQNKLSFLIQIDGGINEETIKYCQDADVIVVGTYITDSNDYQKRINNLI